MHHYFDRPEPISRTRALLTGLVLTIGSISFITWCYGATNCP